MFLSRNRRKSRHTFVKRAPDRIDCLNSQRLKIAAPEAFKISRTAWKAIERGTEGGSGFRSRKDKGKTGEKRAGDQNARRMPREPPNRPQILTLERPSVVGAA
jgi:hypothetical protein